MSASVTAIIEPFCRSLYGSLYSHTTLRTFASDWLWQPADLTRDHLRKLGGLQFSDVSEMECRDLSAIIYYRTCTYLWHCCGYILFAALVSEVWEPPISVTPTVHPPTSLQSVLVLYFWQRPWVMKFTADKEFDDLELYVFCVLGECYS